MRTFSLLAALALVLGACATDEAAGTETPVTTPAETPVEAATEPGVIPADSATSLPSP
ncbi:hypothetical protein [Rubrivirga sp.]|uniref:hypothetical protein n=1 Tax=Rubrivirga sp. TaxID=1885344 RepID=UPI003C743BC5